ncbi:MAG: N-6 DNA methylase [Proteobacteria bacterium]|nr:N-6 DNA methylase [Pseudomonadota bacterium]
MKTNHKEPPSKKVEQTLNQLTNLHHEYIKNIKYEAVLAYNKELNRKLHNHKIQEDKRSLLITGILIALKNKHFRENLLKYETCEQIADAIVDAIMEELQNSNLLNNKSEALRNNYSFIKTHKVLSSDKEFLLNLIQGIELNIHLFIKTYRHYDIFGDFYIEFLKYANNDKGLGIVLTPKHITELFIDLAQIDKDSIVFDNCCGVGGFLMAALHKMMSQVHNDPEKEREIKEKQLIGIEFQDNIFPLTCSNMIIHGDGKTNLFHEDCFNVDVKEIRRKFKPNKGFLNPPFKISADDIEEFEFVLNNLDGLDKGATCIALLPTQCALAQKGNKLAFKQHIFQNHTIDAVLSLPNDLFSNSRVSMATCALIIKAHQPHPKNYKTYFGYWKDDGFFRNKGRGRVDGGRWNEIKATWLDSYLNRKSISGLSMMKTIEADDEWCAENYMETDYSNLRDEDFIKKMHQFSTHQFAIGKIKTASNKPFNKAQIKLDVASWKSFSYGLEDGIFNIENGCYNKKPQADLGGDIPFIGASIYNNGITSWHNSNNIDKIIKGNCITIANNGSVGYAYYQAEDFTCSHDINPVKLKQRKLNPYIALFLCTLIEKERYRWDYGRKWRCGKMARSKIKLPTSQAGEPDWQFIENYIKSLPYSSNL